MKTYMQLNKETKTEIFNDEMLIGVLLLLLYRSINIIMD